MTTLSPPTRFVGLHSHSNGSIFDAIGTPADHINFALSNGSDALALTDHGNMTGYSHQMAHLSKLKKKGVEFKGLFGMEAYFIPSLSEWLKLKTSLAEPTPVVDHVPGDELASTKEELQEISEDNNEDDGGTIVENEEESKSVTKGKNPLRQRNHLVLLAKNDDGLKALFKIASDAAADGSYMGYPRVDMDILRKHAQGNVVALSACIAGLPAKIVFDHQTTPDWKLWVPNTDNFELIQSELAKAISGFQEALGPENYYLEIQFNKLSCVSGDAFVETSSGPMLLKDIVTQVSAGMHILVLSYCELTKTMVFKPVVWGGMTRKNAKVIKIALANGKKLVLTPDHKVFTNFGWLRADELNSKQDVKILNYSSIN